MSSDYRWGQSARIRCLRAYLGLSVNEIAAALDVSYRSYQNFESGRAAIPEGVMDDMRVLVDRLDGLADDYGTRDVLHIGGMTTFELRAAGIAAAADPHLLIEA